MKNKVVAETGRFFLALADETRLRLLNVMRDREVNVNSFVEILGESQPKISRHLAFLRSAGVVEVRRDGKWIFYKISEPSNDFIAVVLEETLRRLTSDDEMQLANEKFLKARGLLPKIKAAQAADEQNVFAETNISEERRRELEIYLL